MKEKDDFILIDEFKAGNEKAFSELINRYKKRIYLTAFHLLGNHEASDDITQEVLIKMYDNLRTFRKDSSVFTWLYKITTNLALNELRKRKVREFLKLDEFLNIFSTDKDTLPDEYFEVKESKDKIQSAIDKLPDRQKVVFSLRYFDELSYEEISKITGTSTGALKANYFHALKKLGQELKNELQ